LKLNLTIAHALILYKVRACAIGPQGHNAHISLHLKIVIMFC